MVWIYNHTESLHVAMLMHASLITFWRILTPLTLSGLTLVTHYLMFTAAMWIIITVALRWQTLHRPQHRADEQQLDHTRSETSCPQVRRLCVW
jgi:hypothetical protein